VVLGIVAAVVVAAVSCSDGGDEATTSTTAAVPDPTTAAPTSTTSTTTPARPGLVGEVGDDGRLTLTVGDEVILASVDESARSSTVSWREAPYTVESKQAVYLGHELLSTPSDDELPWSSGGDIQLEQVSDRVVRVTARGPSAATQVAQSFACRPDERFYGFGAQTWATQHRGQTIPIWVVEQGLGKVTPETPEPAPSLLGEPYDSYIPIPWFWSSVGYGISLDTTTFGTFELCTDDHPDSWRVETWSDELSFHVFVGDTPLELIEAYTDVVGRPSRLPPPWFFAPMNDAVRGQDNVARVAQLLRDNDIPSSVIWTEDWIGIGSFSTGFRLSHDWDVSPTEYPDLAALTDELHADGFRFLGYVSPFIPHADSTPGGPSTDSSGRPIELVAHNQEKWAEAVEGGFFFRDPAGEPYLMLSPPFVPPGGTGLDVTDAEAIEWFQGYLARAEELGLDGSMTDFGEWVPFDAQFADGRTGAEVHNEYPLLWQQANREFWDQARPDGDYLFYVRSGFTGTQRFAPAVWGGDQNTTFDRLDGLGSVITLGVNLGMSGIAFYGHDIAGYSAFAVEGIENTPTTKELFLRWAAIGAYSPMMRTHHGNRYGENWSFEGAPNPDDPTQPIRDDETLATWARLAAEHIVLYPYLEAYGVEAVERGLPIMRHPILLHPDDPVLVSGTPDDEAWADFAAVGRPFGELFEYYLGDQLLVAPIIDEGVTTRPVYLPAGDWYLVATGQPLEGGGTVVAEAAPGEIPVYAPAGAIVPLLPDGVETLVETDDPEIVDHTDVADQLVLDVYLGADGSFELADGTRIELQSTAAGRPRSATADRSEVTLVDGDRATTLVTAEADDVTIELELDASSAVIAITGAPLPRAYTVNVIG
jgi:alpha-glucosidase (family GH31 glycosyl hydrolase)